MRRPKHLLVPALVILGLLYGCSAHHATSDVPPDCDRFVAKFESCLATTIPSLPNVARQRAAQTRTALQEEAERAGASATPPAALAALATKCQANLERLTASCSPTASR